MTDITLSASSVVMREKVFEIERQMLEMPQVELLVTHHFSPGICARAVHIPAGVTLSGRIHKYENLNILSKGDMSVSTDNGMQRVQAGFHVVSPPGTKRIAHAHEDCIWTTILHTFETDPEKIEEFFTTNDEQEYLAFVGNLTLEGK